MEAKADDGDEVEVVEQPPTAESAAQATVGSKSQPSAPTAAQRMKWAVTKPLGATAAVWDYFGVYTLMRMLGHAVCLLCRLEVNRGADRSTTPLIQHLRHHHPEVLIDGVVKRLQAEGRMDEFATVSPGFLDAFVKWLVMTQQPLSVCENEYFERMVHSLNPKVQVPYRSKIDNRLIEIEAQVRAAITALVAGQYVACTTDAWTSVANVSYCSLTLAYVNAAWELVNLSLDCSAFPGSHDGQAIAAKLTELLDQYQIPVSHVVAAVTDTAPNMVRSARFMSYDWHGCMAHMLELVTGETHSI